MRRFLLFSQSNNVTKLQNVFVTLHMKPDLSRRMITNAFRLKTRGVVIRIIRFMTKFVELLHILIVSPLMVIVQRQYLVVTIPMASLKGMWIKTHMGITTPMTNLEGMLIKVMHMARAMVPTISVQEHQALNVIHPHVVFHLNTAKTELKKFAKS